MHTTGYADVTHSLADSTMPKRMYKVSGHCSIWIWKVHVWHLSVCALSMTLKNSDLLSTAHFSSNVTAIGLLAAMPHGFFAMEAAILLLPSWNLPYLEAAILAAWVAILLLPFTSNSKLKCLSDKKSMKHLSG